jgi:predicted nucleic acid-binding protein
LSGFVLDCSVSAAWCLKDETSEAAGKILQRLAHEEALVPSVWTVEMANVLVAAERKGRITPSDARRAIELVLSLPIKVESADLRRLNACRLLAREHGLSAYDAAYLELAQRAGLPLATMDRALSTAASNCGVPCCP